MISEAWTNKADLNRSVHYTIQTRYVIKGCVKKSEVTTFKADRELSYGT